MSEFARRLAPRSVICFSACSSKITKINHKSFLTSTDRLSGCSEGLAVSHAYFVHSPRTRAAFCSSYGSLGKPAVMRSISLFARCRLATGLLTVQSDELFVWLALLPSFLPPKECQRKMGLWAKMRPYRLGGSHG